MCNTKHKPDCRMAFGRKDKSCPRCIELLAGAPARDSWHAKHKRDEEMRSRMIANHYDKHGKCKCGVVCTAFDW